MVSWSDNNNNDDNNNNNNNGVDQTAGRVETSQAAVTEEEESNSNGNENGNENENENQNGNNTSNAHSTPESKINREESFQLFCFLRQQMWDKLVNSLEVAAPDTIMAFVDENDHIIVTTRPDYEAAMQVYATTLLHEAVSLNSRIPLYVVETILKCSGNPKALASMLNHLQQTSLLKAVLRNPERTDIVECLLQAAPQTVRQGDGDTNYLRPIDILCHKIIMMEEVIKYSPQEEDAKLLDSLWETVHILAIYSANDSSSSSRRNHYHRHHPPRRRQGEDEEEARDQHATANTHQENAPQTKPPIVHSCLKSIDFPFALTERAMKRYPNQLFEQDSNGDLPLHAICSVAPPPRGGGGGSDDDDDNRGDGEEADDEDDESDFLDRVLSKNQGAPSQRNSAGQIPLAMALASGRRWNSGILRLLEAYPAGIEVVGLPQRLFPFLFERLWQSQQIDTIYGIFQAEPELYFDRHPRHK